VLIKTFRIKGMNMGPETSRAALMGKWWEARPTDVTRHHPHVAHYPYADRPSIEVNMERLLTRPVPINDDAESFLGEAWNQRQKPEPFKPSVHHPHLAHYSSAASDSQTDTPEVNAYAQIYGVYR
jgi:hypothetical protein